MRPAWRGSIRFSSVIEDGSSLRIELIVDIVVSPRKGRVPDAIS
jgi:hypothetical protein